MQKILDQIGNDQTFVAHMPIPKEIRKVPKQWIINIAYSVLGEGFAAWIKTQIEERNTKVTVEKNLMINLDPDIAAAFNASTDVSRK